MRRPARALASLNVEVYLEVGRKRVFGGALDWPGWARSGRDEASALAALVAYGPRYRDALGETAGGLRLPTGADELTVNERLPGDSTTDFGAPGQIPTADWRPADDAALDQSIAILRAAWRAFDAAAERAEGHVLATGPRGGGRSVAKMREHVADADRSYLGGLGGRAPADADWPAVQAAFVDALLARARGQVADVGPRGGRRWPARYAIRRSAWHALDHAWELEDRAGF